MGVPKSKHRALTRRPLRPVRIRAKPTAAEREAAEDRADQEAADRAIADWERRGRPRGIPWEQVKRELALLK